MKTTKKESTKTSSEFPREIESIRNGSFFGIMNRGILPLQSHNHNFSQSANPFLAYHNQSNPWSYGANQFNTPFFGVHPFSTSPFFPSSSMPSSSPMMNPFMSSPFTGNTQHNFSNPAFFGAQEVSTTANISEDEESYTIEMTVPGYRNADCKVRVKDNVLFVYGRREMEKETAFYSLKENRNTFFERTFLLSNEIETDEIEANCADGILTIILPKKESDSLVEKDIEITEEEMA
jgi:HSP20 family protein